MENKILILLGAFIFCMTLGLKDAMAAAATNVECKNPSINSYEIEDGQVVAADIANNAVTNAKIADGAVTNTKILDGQVTAPKIADGAVTDAKITGPISTSKLNVGTTPGTVAAGDHNHDSLYQKKYANVIVVAKAGGDYTDPVTAMNNLSAWCGTPSATNPCLLKIMPGVYNIGANSLQMQSYVDIEGSGENTTKISGSISSPYFPPTQGVITASAPTSNAELRFLTVENIDSWGGVNVAIYNNAVALKITNVTATTALYGSSNYAVYNYTSSTTMTNVTATASNGSSNRAVYNRSSSTIMTNVTATASVSSVSGGSSNYGVENVASSSMTMANVTATASGPSGSNYGINNNFDSSLIMTNSTVTAWGGSVYNIGIYNITNSSLTIVNSTVTASDGVQSYSLTTKIDHSVIIGTRYTITTGYTGSVIYVGNTRLEGGPVLGTFITCAGVYDENYVFYANTCP